MLTLLLYSHVGAAQLTVNNNGYDWRKATDGEHRTFVIDTQKRVKALYPAHEMLACIEEVFADPIRAHIHERKLVIVMAVCDNLIK